MSMPDINSPEVQEQFAQMGMKPEDVLTQIMSDPELAQAFQDPKVQAAVMDCSTNPMNITKYQNDPQIMGVFEKLAALFPQDRLGHGRGCNRPSRVTLDRRASQFQRLLLIHASTLPSS